MLWRYRESGSQTGVGDQGIELYPGGQAVCEPVKGCICCGVVLQSCLLGLLSRSDSLNEEGTVWDPQLLRNVRVSDKKTALENEKVKAAIEAAAEALGDDGRILVRERGTEPLIRVMVEAGTDDLCHKYVDSVVDVMEAEGLVVE